MAREPSMEVAIKLTQHLQDQLFAFAQAQPDESLDMVEIGFAVQAFFVAVNRAVLKAPLEKVLEGIRIEYDARDKIAAGPKLVTS